MMKNLCITLLSVLLLASPVRAEFNLYGVWEAVSSTELAKGQSVSFGTQRVQDRERDYTVLVYRSGSDSTKAVLVLYGMMSYALADTVQRYEVLRDTMETVASVTVLSDSLIGLEHFPFMYGTLKNTDADSSATFTVYVYTREETTLRLR
jgi:hypothetical protein